MKNCHACIHWSCFMDRHVDSGGRCRRYPPTIQGEDGEGSWPECDRDDWCSEFSLRNWSCPSYGAVKTAAIGRGLICSTEEELGIETHVGTLAVLELVSHLKPKGATPKVSGEPSSVMSNTALLTRELEANWPDADLDEVLWAKHQSLLAQNERAAAEANRELA